MSKRLKSNRRVFFHQKLIYLFMIFLLFTQMFMVGPISGVQALEEQSEKDSIFELVSISDDGEDSNIEVKWANEKVDITSASTHTFSLPSEYEIFIMEN